MISPHACFLPARKAEGLHDPANPLRRDSAYQGVEEINRFSVLYVEDDESIRLLLLAYLVRHSYPVQVASNGLEGWQLYQSNNPKLIITDIAMPVMDGTEMARRIKSADRACPIIYVTATPERLNGFAQFDPDIDRVLKKPFRLEELGRLLDEYAAPIQTSKAFE